MAHSRAEYLESIEKVAKRGIVSHRSQFEAAKRAALDATRVTGDANWDRFLEILQEKINTCKQRIEVAETALRDSDDFTTETLINQKLAVRLFGKELETLEYVIGLPQTLIDQGTKAKEALERIE